MLKKLAAVVGMVVGMGACGEEMPTSPSRTVVWECTATGRTYTQETGIHPQPGSVWECESGWVKK